jgi:hypothetical protein
MFRHIGMMKPQGTGTSLEKKNEEKLEKIKSM